MAEAGATVLVAYVAAGGEVLEVAVPFRAGMNVGEAVHASGLAARFPEVLEAKTGVWGKLREAEAALASGERVEIYRPLIADPNDSRLARARKKASAKQRAGK